MGWLLDHCESNSQVPFYFASVLMGTAIHSKEIHKEIGQFLDQQVVGEIYRVSTKELYTSKMIQKTNAAYLELRTYTSRQKKCSKFCFK
jgi:hypothetical protein